MKRGTRRVAAKEFGSPGGYRVVRGDSAKITRLRGSGTEVRPAVEERGGSGIANFVDSFAKPSRSFGRCRLGRFFVRFARSESSDDAGRGAGARESATCINYARKVTRPTFIGQLVTPRSRSELFPGPPGSLASLFQFGPDSSPFSTLPFSPLRVRAVIYKKLRLGISPSVSIRGSSDAAAIRIQRFSLSVEAGTGPSTREPRG